PYTSAMRPFFRIGTLAAYVALAACGGSNSGGAGNDDDASSDGTTDGTTTSDGTTNDGASGDAGDGGPIGSMAVYPGCASPSTTFARTVYVDPSKGTDTGDGSTASPLRTLTTALAKKKISPGDHVVLFAGDHGVVQVSKSSNPEL